MSKTFLYIGGAVFVLLTLMFVADFFLNIPVLRSVPGINKITCQFPVTVSGSSMEPTIKAGSRINFNKCFQNKENLPTGTIILYSGERNTSIARIKERVPQQDRFIYKVGRDNRPGESIEVNPDRILGILNNSLK